MFTLARFYNSIVEGLALSLSIAVVEPTSHKSKINGDIYEICLSVLKEKDFMLYLMEVLTKIHSRIEEISPENAHEEENDRDISFGGENIPI